MSSLTRGLLIALLVLYAVAATGADTIKIALIAPLSGARANVGQSNLKNLQAAAEYANSHGGALGLQFEIVAFDSKSSPDEALRSLDAAIRQGVRYVAHGSGSEIAAALSDAIDKHSAANPARSVLFLNIGSGDSATASDTCSFWHFRFDADRAMRLRALIEGIANDRAARRIYLLNPDDPAGHSLSRDAQRVLSEKRPDLQFIGKALYPMGKVDDFAPYMPDLIDAGLDTVVTASRGAELSRLIRAAHNAGLKAKFYTLYAWLPGASAEIGAAGADRVKTVLTWHANISGSQLEAFANDFKTKYQEDWRGLPGFLAVQMLATAMETSRSTDPRNIARVLEGLSYLGPNGPVWMRRDDHQLFQPLFLATLTNAGIEGVKYDTDTTGYGWRTDARIEADQTLGPATCKMQRPR